jgi:tetratricopeptide (TPR) repeat protein
MPAGSLPLARAIAVLGGDVPLARAVRLAGLDEASALVALDALVRADLVFSGARLRFTHPIIRAAIYDELAPGERTVLHRRAAELLTAEGAEIDAVAAQLLASEPSGSSEVVSQLRAAASHAVARGAAEDAIAYLTRALAEGSERARQADLSLRLGMAARMAGQPALMNQHFQEAFRLAEDPRVRTRAALELATLLMFLGEWERPSALVETALSDLGDREPALTLRLRTLQTAIYASDPSLVGQLDARLPELRQLAATGTKGTRALALLLAAVAAWRGLPSGEVVELFERGWDRGRVLRDPGRSLGAVAGRHCARDWRAARPCAGAGRGFDGRGP